MGSESAFGNTMDIQCLASQTARSSGDALRELDAMGVSISPPPDGFHADEPRSLTATTLSS